MASSWRRGLVLAGLLSSTLAPAGCGTSVAARDTRYANQLQSAQLRFAGGVNDVMRGTAARAAAATTADAVGRFETQLAGIELSLRAIHAPGVVSRMHRHLIKTIDRYGAEVRRIVSALRAPATATLASSQQRFRVATTRMSADVQDTFRRIAAAVQRERAGATP